MRKVTHVGLYIAREIVCQFINQPTIAKKRQSRGQNSYESWTFMHMATVNMPL